MLSFLPEQIELWPIARLRPYERNPRLRSDDHDGMQVRLQAEGLHTLVGELQSRKVKAA